MQRQLDNSHISFDDAVTAVSRGAVRTGVLVLGPATYATAWGAHVMTGPHMRIDEPDLTQRLTHPYYGCELVSFVRDYVDADTPGAYCKRVAVKAVKVVEPTVVHTLEGPMNAPAGSWILQDTAGAVWPISDATFRATYEVQQ